MIPTRMSTFSESVGTALRLIVHLDPTLLASSPPCHRRPLTCRESRVVYLDRGRVLADLPASRFFEGPLHDIAPEADLFLKGELG